MHMMQPSPWRKLAELPGARGVKAEWGNFPADLLTLTQQTAAAVPCRGSGVCYRHVVEHTPGDLVGVCTSYPTQCDKRPLSKIEVAIHRLDQSRLFDMISWTIDMDTQSEQVSWTSKLWRVGIVNTHADKLIPVFFSFAAKTSHIERTVNVIAMHHTAPFLLLLASGSMANMAAHETAERFRGKILGLDDLLAVSSSGDVVAKKSGIASVKQWVDSLLSLFFFQL